MTQARSAYLGARIFDGVALRDDHALLVLPDRTTRITAPQDLPSECPIHTLDGGTLLSGFVDLQVNGGGGVMFNDAPTVETLATIVTAHRGLGTAAILPTLITDTPAQTAAAIKAVTDALDQRIPGIAGLHLEGPHLSVARKGAHDGTLIRPMQDSDLRGLLDAADRIPNLMVTVAPENVTNTQIRTLADAGIIVSLGHSDCDYDTAMAAFDAGARCATHLFNAMSQAQARAPGLVGAALSHPMAACGLIADGVHVHPAMIRAALAAKTGPSDIFLVTDAMATAGSDITSFQLNGREILRSDGKLTLADGTLAGADLTMPQAISVLVEQVIEPFEKALARATTIPAGMLRSPPSGNRVDDLLWLSQDMTQTRWITDL
jgi:N-acetylglucosamine-6-phosphate deacetylase